jgi:hypothetical protein
MKNRYLLYPVTSLFTPLESPTIFRQRRIPAIAGGGDNGGGVGTYGGGNGGGPDAGVTAGAANTGGGGGARSADVTVTGKDGGSGIVIIRYPR